MGRAPCCDKANVKKGPWSPEEDAKLKSYIDHNGTGGNWIALPQKIGLKRCGKSCRLRWLNYLRPNIKHGGFSEEEDNLICSLYISIGSRWSIIAAQLPGRTDNDIKNYWNTRLKKKLLGKQRKDHHHRRLKSTNTTAAPPNHQHDLAMSSQLAAPDSSDNSTTTTTTVHDSLVVDLPHHHYWPTAAATAGLPPIPYSSEEPRLNDHASIRKLLIKLGGRFSNCSASHHHQQLIVPETTTAPLFEAASASVEGSEALGRHHYCDMDGGVLLEMLQGNTTSHRDDGEDADHERLEYGLEFLLSGSDGEQQGIMSNGEPSDQLVYDEQHNNHPIFQGDYHNAFDELRPYPHQAGSM
ncbi:unnamed protein product [Linum tenue]|uniref:Uncharacterized protein n=1 Tax=Linum tenue TaxID=586396 RepID=A0AAV0P0J6_9ROSI|nr:unnamed protein product [Linum tenue]